MEVLPDLQGVTPVRGDHGFVPNGGHSGACIALRRGDEE